MNFSSTLFASLLLVAGAQFACAFPGFSSLQNAANATCIVKRNVDGRMLQVSEVVGSDPQYGVILFTDLNLNTTKWNVVPVENSTGLFLLRNIQYDQYLAIQEAWCTSYSEGYGNFADYMWRWEGKTEILGDIIHYSTNLCMDVARYDPPAGSTVYFPVMIENCTDKESFFAISCADAE